MATKRKTNVVPVKTKIDELRSKRDGLLLTPGKSELTYADGILDMFNEVKKSSVLCKC